MIIPSVVFLVERGYDPPRMIRAGGNAQHGPSWPFGLGIDDFKTVARVGWDHYPVTAGFGRSLGDKRPGHGPVQRIPKAGMAGVPHGNTVAATTWFGPRTA